MRRILTIDGGGIRGVFQASFLATIEDTIQDKISNYFDLMVGTSTGGIIILGLGIGFTAKEILNFYLKSGPSIFCGNRMLRFLRHIGLSKYSSGALKKALEEQFGNRRLGEATKRIVIPTLNLETGEIYIYKTAHHERLQRDYKEKIVDIALATAAAPTYFPTHRSASGTPLIDGGIWANNPVGLAVVEAIGVLKWPKESLKVLSIGCTSVPISIGLGRRLPFGIAYWAPRIVDVFMLAQSSASIGTAQNLAGHKNVIRIDPTVSKGKFSIDLVEEIASLQGLGHSEARKALPLVREIFLTSHAEKFTPIWKLDET